MIKKFDTIKMVRRIREDLSYKTQKMSSKELIMFYKNAARRIQIQRQFSKN